MIPALIMFGKCVHQTCCCLRLVLMLTPSISCHVLFLCLACVISELDLSAGSNYTNTELGTNTSFLPNQHDVNQQSSDPDIIPILENIFGPPNPDAEPSNCTLSLHHSAHQYVDVAVGAVCCLLSITGTAGNVAVLWNVGRCSKDQFKVSVIAS